MGIHETAWEHAMEHTCKPQDLSYGRSHALWPWPDQEARERKRRVADETRFRRTPVSCPTRHASESLRYSSSSFAFEYY